MLAVMTHVVEVVEVEERWKGVAGGGRGRGRGRELSPHAGKPDETAVLPTLPHQPSTFRFIILKYNTYLITCIILLTSVN